MTLLPNWAKALGNEDGMPRRISNSEISAYLQCERKWYYGYALNLEPVSVSTALSRGVIGHEALAKYYEGIKEGVSHNEASENAVLLVMDYMRQPNAEVQMLSELITLLERYFAICEGFGWKILAVEQAYEIPVDESFGYVMRLDLVVQDREKRTLIVDHKFVYDFWSQEDLDLNPQIPKYIGTLRFNGFNIDGAIVNQIRHRLKKRDAMADDELFKQSPMYPTQAEIRQVLKEQFKASEQTMLLRQEPDLGESKILRTMNKMTCKNCSMLPLCKADLMGSDTTIMRQVDYHQNVTYGYNNDEDKV